MSLAIRIPAPAALILDLVDSSCFGALALATLLCFGSWPLRCSFVKLAVRSQTSLVRACTAMEVLYAACFLLLLRVR